MTAAARIHFPLPLHHLLRALVLLVALAGASCRHEEPEEVIARVGDAVLTRQAANARVDTAGPEYRRHLAAYVASWINAQLIYQEARRSGIENSDAFTSAVDDARRQLANQMFLDAYVTADSVDTSETALRGYYDSHATEFVVGEEMVKLNMVSFERRERASAFVARYGRNADWAAAVRSTDSTAGLVAARYYTQHTLFPPELWKAASSLGLNEVSFPIKTALGYVVVQPVAFARQGAQADFDAVHDEVRERVVMEHRNRRYRELLGTLRQRTTVEIVSGAELLPPDSTPAPDHD